MFSVSAVVRVLEVLLCPTYSLMFQVDLCQACAILAGFSFLPHVANSEHFIGYFQTPQVASQSEQPDSASLQPSPTPNEITKEMYMKLKKENEALKKENIDVVANNVVLKVKVGDLSAKLKKARQEKNYFFNLNHGAVEEPQVPTNPG